MKSNRLIKQHTDYSNTTPITTQVSLTVHHSCSLSFQA